MVKYIVNSKDTRIRDADYLFEDVDKFKKLLPYLRKKIEGTWEIAILEPDIKSVREFADSESIPGYVTVSLYLDRHVAEQIASEKPKLFIKEKTAYEKYLDLISDMKILIEPKAAKELYQRVGTDKSKIPEYLQELSNTSNEKITVNDVRKTVNDERRLYASDVVNAFLLKTRWRWSQYNKLVSNLGRDYAYFSMRKYISKLLEEKNDYLQNKDTTLRVVDKIDALSINLAYVLFNTTKASELDTCMYLLDNKAKARSVLEE